MADNNGPLLAQACVSTANGQAAGLCSDFELVCFEPAACLLGTDNVFPQVVVNQANVTVTTNSDIIIDDTVFNTGIGAALQAWYNSGGPGTPLPTSVFEWQTNLCDFVIAEWQVTITEILAGQIYQLAWASSIAHPDGCTDFDAPIAAFEACLTPFVGGTTGFTGAGVNPGGSYYNSYGLVAATVEQAWLYTVIDCDPLSPNQGTVILAEYRDINNITTQVTPNTPVAICAGASVGNVDIENRALCDRVVVSPGVGNDPDLITLTEFYNVEGFDTATGARVVGPVAIDALGNPYTVVGTAVECPEIEQRVTPLCEYDPATQARIGEFDRITYNEVSTGHIVLNSLGLPFYDVDIQDPSVAYTLTPGTITRDCQNEVDCDNDPCVPATQSQTALPANGGTTLFSSFQLDPPLTNPGVRWKIDFFEQGADPLVLAQLTAWMQSGPGGILPPENEIFVWRGLQGGPAALNPANPPTPLWAGTPFDLIIPGWAVTDYIVAGGGAFVNIWVDLTRTNPQLCDLTTVVLDPVNFPGVTIDAMITTADGYFADALANLTQPSAPFPVANNATPSADIYRLTSGNPIQADSVVLCKTVTTATVCYTGEDEPLVRVSGINPVGQTVFEFFKTVETGAIVVPQGDPIDCTEKALSRFGGFCGDCDQALNTNVAITGTTFQMSPIDAAPLTGYAHRIQDGTTNIATVICNFLQTADPRDILRIPITGNVFLGTQSMIIPRWMVTIFDCSIPGEVFFSIDITQPHPDGCPDPFANVPNLQQYIGLPGGATLSFTRFFLNTTTGTFSTITLNGQADIQTYTPNGNSGEALRVADCCTDAEVQILCDVQTDGTVVEFIRNFEHLCADGSLVVQEDFELDGTTPYTPVGTVRDCFASSLTSCDEEQCTSGQLDALRTYLPTGGADAITQPNSVAPYAVTLDYSSDPQLADDIEACINSGGFAILQLTLSIFGGTVMAFGGVGLTNLVNTGTGILTFDYDPIASFNEVQNSCPASLTVTIPSLQGSLINADSILSFFPFFPGSTDTFSNPQLQCFTFVFTPEPVPAQRVEVCNLPTAECGPCAIDDASIVTQPPLPAAPNSDLFEVINIAGSVRTWRITDGAAPTGIVAALQAWWAGTDDVFIWLEGLFTDPLLAFDEPVFLIRDKVILQQQTPNSVTFQQEFAPFGDCNLDQVGFPQPPAPAPGFVVSEAEEAWRNAIDAVEATFGVFFQTPIEQDPANFGIITAAFEDRPDDALKVKLCDIDMLAQAIADAQAQPSSVVRRRARVTQILGGTNLNIDTLNACSIEWIVLQGTATYDGITFNVGEGLRHGDDANETLIEDAGTGIGSNGIVRISYTELF